MDTPLASRLEFLAAQPPFDALDRGVLEAIVGRAQPVSFAAKTTILVEDGPPAAGVWVVERGSVELLHQGECIEQVEPGGCFGQLSLLSTMAPAFTAYAREPCNCIWIGRDDALAVYGTPAGAGALASSLRRRLVGSGHTVHGLQDVGTTPVSAIMRPARWLAPGATIADAARALGEPAGGAVLIEMAHGEVGIIGDAEVRAGLGRDGFDATAPAAKIARVPAPRMPVGQLAVEAAVDMLAADSESVVVREGERIVGTLTARELVGLDAHSPIALRHTIMGAADLGGLLRSVSHLPKLFCLLVAAGVPPRDIGRVLSLQHDAIARRLIEISINRLGPPPVAWAWLDLGSASRREFTLASDQDNALAYADSAVGGRECGGGHSSVAPGAESVDAYFAALGKDVNDGLARCGVGVDNNGVMAGERLWRMSKAAWLRTFDECFAQPDESRLVRATVAFDFRAAAGGLAVSADLSAKIRTARSHPEFMRLIARSASGFPVSLGRRGALAVERQEDGTAKLDLKRGAIVPVVNLVRYHALAAGVTISPTLDRIEAVAAAGGLDRAAADALAEAFEVITRARLQLHARQIADGLEPDNLVDPAELAPIARAELRAALHAVRRAQRKIVA